MICIIFLSQNTIYFYPIKTAAIAVFNDTYQIQNGTK